MQFQIKHWFKDISENKIKLETDNNCHINNNFHNTENAYKLLITENTSAERADELTNYYRLHAELFNLPSDFGIPKDLKPITKYSITGSKEHDDKNNNNSGGNSSGKDEEKENLRRTIDALSSENNKFGDALSEVINAKSNIENTKRYLELALKNLNALNVSNQMKDNIVGPIDESIKECVKALAIFEALNQRIKGNKK
jgi:hypothetical protein